MAILAERCSADMIGGLADGRHAIVAGARVARRARADRLGMVEGQCRPVGGHMAVGAERGCAEMRRPLGDREGAIVTGRAGRRGLTMVKMHGHPIGGDVAGIAGARGG